jgi:hypothetical protein
MDGLHDALGLPVEKLWVKSPVHDKGNQQAGHGQVDGAQAVSDQGVSMTVDTERMERTAASR